MCHLYYYSLDRSANEKDHMAAFFAKFVNVEKKSQIFPFLYKIQNENVPASYGKERFVFIYFNNAHAQLNSI